MRFTKGLGLDRNNFLLQIQEKTLAVFNGQANLCGALKAFVKLGNVTFMGNAV